MSPAIISLFLRETINAGQLNFDGVDFGQVTTARFQEFLFHFSSPAVRFLNGCNFPEGQRLKDLGRALSARDVRLWRSSQGKWSVWSQEKGCWQKSNEP
ncbi:hypothetical protein AAVH_35854 [Aphelenchoides avenae]|nr:hypothetical protein AAVH_35854 [Aphelenchus avenae]